MAKYSLIRDFMSPADANGLPFDLSDNDGSNLVDHIDVEPAWVIAVVRWKIATTFSRDNMSSSINANNTNITDILDILVISNDVVSMDVGGSKESFSPTLNAIFTPNRDYLAEILTDDWVLGWIVNSNEKAADLIDRINRFKPCNQFNDGLKFVGKVNSVRESLGVTDDGLKTLRYTLSCSAFKELDSKIFYNQYLAVNYRSISEYMSALGTSLNKLISLSGGGIDSNRILPELIELLLGRGVSPRFSSPGGMSVAYGGTGTGTSTDTGQPPKEAPYAYVIPSVVGSLLGQSQPSRVGGVFSYADILDSVIGVQRYRGTTNSGMTGPESVFTADTVGTNTGNRQVTGYPLLGIFSIQAVNFTDNSVWTILQQFLNPAVNEMYASLRVNASGNVVPTLIARQFPFTTEIGAENTNPSVQVTPFLELPRWHIHPILVKHIDRGRSSTVRFNFVQITGQDIMAQANNSPTEQTIRNPPIRDDMDAKRNGLHPYQINIACNHKDTFGGGLSKWINLISDFLINQELTLNGTFTLQGIQAPICIGDNIEFNDMVYHIEGCSHHCEISSTGRKKFLTSLAVTHGMVADPDVSTANITVPIGPMPPAHDDTKMYYAIRSSTGTHDDTGAATQVVTPLSGGGGGPRVTTELANGNSKPSPAITPLSSADGYP